MADWPNFGDFKRRGVACSYLRRGAVASARLEKLLDQLEGYIAEREGYAESSESTDVCVSQVIQLLTYFQEDVASKYAKKPAKPKHQDLYEKFADALAKIAGQAKRSLQSGGWLRQQIEYTPGGTNEVQLALQKDMCILCEQLQSLIAKYDNVYNRSDLLVPLRATARALIELYQVAKDLFQGTYGYSARIEMLRSLVMAANTLLKGGVGRWLPETQKLCVGEDGKKYYDSADADSNEHSYNALQRELQEIVGELNTELKKATEAGDSTNISVYGSLKEEAIELAKAAGVRLISDSSPAP